jgi:adenine-specific DNA-methyltransferase
MIDFSLPYSKPDFNSFLEGFLPEDYGKQEEEINVPFRSKYFKQATYLGESKKLNLSVYEVRHTSEHDARVGLTREMFRLMAAFGKRRSLVVLVPQSGNTYRFSLVTIDLKLDKNEKITRDYSNPKRYSFILGEGAKLHTPQKFLISQGRVSRFDDLLQRFSVEVVNKEFYNQIAVMFSRLVGGKRKQGSRTNNYEHVLELPSTPYDGNEQKYKEFAVRLIGRTVFCWFLKKKKSANDIPLIPEDVLSTQAISQNPNYYHSRVEPLFFNVLNTPVNERTEEFKEKPYDKIPFLNGGLFEPQPDDFYSQNRPNYALRIPDEWWKDFIEILETYNFTIDENTSIDIDLSVDPEMLGRIFENLLAEINPETGETARKSTGSYYTPRPIVDYMVDESLKQYLVTKTGIDEDNLEILLDYSREESGLEPQQESKVISALNEIKVLDPACGSGAFPMGILQKMLLILQKVDHGAKNSIQQILNDIQDPVYRKLLESKLKAAQVYDDDDLDDYARKLNIIRRSIYGVDIQPVAVDIAKLRFFLSIIVDEVIQDELPNRGIEPLPNLEFKFVCANTLIPLPPNRELFENADFIEKLEELREQYFISFGAEKENIKKDFRKVQGQMFNDSINLLNRESGTHNDRPQTQTQMLATWNPFSNETTKWFDPKWMFGETDGFDVVIGNPPYLRVDKIEKTFRNKLNQIYSVCTGKYDLYFLFYEKGILLTKSKGTLCFITPNRFTTTDSGEVLRKLTLRKFKNIVINSVSKIRVFDNASTYPAIIILKEKDQLFENLTLKESKIYKDLKIISEDNIFKKNEIELFPKTVLPLNSNRKVLNIYFRIKEETEALSKYLKIQEGLRIPTKIEKFKGDLHIVKQYQFNRYSSIKTGSYVLKDDFEEIINPNSERVLNCLKEKILISEDALQIDATIDVTKSICQGGLYFATLLDNYLNIYFLLAILNSKLQSIFYSNLFSGMHMGGGYLRFRSSFLHELPIVYIKNISEIFEQKTKKIIENKHNGVDSKTIETQIDLMVYKLYELTYDEALIVDPELPGIISREDYEKAGIEEMAEWEIN